MQRFSIGLSALRTSQYLLESVSNNISNAGTEGFHRRQVDLQARSPQIRYNFRVGDGVDVGNVRRLRDAVAEDTLLSVSGDVSRVDRLVTVQRQIEAALLAGDDAIGQTLDTFFSDITRLSSAPGEVALQTSVRESAADLSDLLRNSAAELNGIRTNLELQIFNEIEQANQHFIDVSTTSDTIARQLNQGTTPNHEYDQRDLSVSKLNEIVGLRRYDEPDGDMTLIIGRHASKQGLKPDRINVVQTGQQIELYLNDSSQPLDLEGGRLAGLLELYNATVPQFHDRLDNLAHELIHQVNQIHATGLGSAGGYQFSIGNVQVADSTQLLQGAFPNANLTAGEITVGLVDDDGVRTTEVISIDPAADTLDDVLLALNAVTGFSGQVRADDQKIQFMASPGLKFDFSGGFATEPDMSLVTGTSVATLTGAYQGDSNQDISVQIVGSGTVGSANSLVAEVYSAGGDLLRQFNLGEGYEPGSEVELWEGVRVSFSAGDLNNADQFSTRLTANGDTSGLLSAIGVNAFFSGSNADDITVDENVLRDSTRLAVGLSGDVSDTRNLRRMMDLADATIMPESQTLSQYSDQTGMILGFEISANTSLSASLNAYQNRLEQERDSVSGVDLNEELVNLQRYQKAYEAAVRVIQANDNLLTELLNII